jgi:hypothetical protein
MADRPEAKELHISATVEGERGLSELDLENKVEDMLNRIARESGIRVTDIHVEHVGEEEPGVIESEADWFGE